MAHSYRQEFETHAESEIDETVISENGKHENERRDKIDIILEILEITNQPVKKTHILYTAKINFYQLSRYLGLLVNMGLVKEVSQPFDGYRITEKGKLMLKLFVPSRP